jgi:hypothetical protein
MTYHKTQFGQFGNSLPVDLDGFTHTTAAEWLAAPLDAIDGPPSEDWAEEQATRAIQELADANQAIQEWRVNSEY